MDYPKITRLYKYSALTSYSISALVTGKLWFPFPSTFNDPFDCSVINYPQDFFDKEERRAKRAIPAPTPLGAEDLTSGRLDSALRNIRRTFLASETRRNVSLADRFKQASGATQAFLLGFGVLSLSETPRSILMWSHYGAQHSGICMKFKRIVDNKLGTEAKPVRYMGRRTITNASNPMFEKYTGWQYEREWRLLERKGNQLYDYPGDLLSVICGARMTLSEVDRVQKVVATLNSSRTRRVLVKFALMHPSRYSIAIKSRRLDF